MAFKLKAAPNGPMYKNFKLGDPKKLAVPGLMPEVRPTGKLEIPNPGKEEAEEGKVLKTR